MDNQYNTQQNIIGIGLGLLAGYFTIKLVDSIFKTSESDNKCRPRIFISHSWKHSKYYHIIKSKLECNNIAHYNHSIPKEKRLNVTTERAIKREIRKKIKRCSSLVVSAGMFANSYWIKEEVRMAREMGKKIIAVKPRGARKIPIYLQNRSIEVIGSYAPTLIDRITCDI